MKYFILAYPDLCSQKRRACPGGAQGAGAQGRGRSHLGSPARRTSWPAVEETVVACYHEFGNKGHALP